MNNSTQYELSVPIGQALNEQFYIPKFEALFRFEEVVPRKQLDLYMDFAKRTAQESYCVRKQVGAVVVTKNLGTFVGYNGTAPGDANVCELEDGTTSPFVDHAEQNAFDKMFRSGVSAEGAVLFITLSPCIDCAKRIRGAGVRDVIFAEQYRNDEGITYLEEHGVNVHMYDGNKLHYAWDLLEVAEEDADEHERKFLASTVIN